MIFKQSYHVKLCKSFTKILYLTATASNFAFLGMSGIGRDVLAVCNKQGQILYQYNFSKPVDSFAQPYLDQILVIQTRMSRIAIFDVKLFKVQYLPFQCIFQESDQSGLQTFRDSSLLCVRQNGNHNDHRLKLSYFQCPLSPKSKSIASYESKDDQWTTQMIIKKGNQHSMIIWFKSRNDQQFDLNIYDLKEEVPFRRICAINKINDGLSLQKLQCALLSVWQAQTGKFCLICLSNKVNITNNQSIINNNFILQESLLRIRQTQFIFEGKNQNCLIDYMNLGDYSMFRTFAYDNGVVIKSPIYYVNNSNQKIVVFDSWECTYRSKYFVPGVGNSRLIQGQYQNGDVNHFKVCKIDIFDMNEIYVHFLLTICQNFDDDLIKDATELLSN